MFSKYLTIPEAAEILRKSPSTVQTDVTRNPKCLPPFVRVGRRVLFPDALLHEWVKNKLVNIPQLKNESVNRGRPAKNRVEMRAGI